MTVVSRTRRVIALISALLAGLFTVVLLQRPADAVATSDAVSRSITVNRVDVGADGVPRSLDRKRTITVTVDHTTDVRGRQELAVSWRGAHPTGGVIADVNSGDASQQEYPFVLLECRGTAKTITPQTCWTQTSQERYQDDYSSEFPSYRVDLYASAHDRGQFVNQPSPLSKNCFTGYLAAHWVPFVGVDKKVYPGGAGGCAGVAPEATDVGGAGLPSNATYGVTAADGSGSADFDVFTQDENASLGCSDTVACALVAIPIEGISCDAYGSTDANGLPLPDADQVPVDQAADVEAQCRRTGAYRVGEQFNAGVRTEAPVTGALWWSASNWRNRMTIPLTFATPASVCSVVNSGPSLNIYGSVLLSELTAQWQPKFCTDKSLFAFTHVQTGDPAARNLVASGEIEAAFSSEAPPLGYGRPVVQAPVAVTGFAIAYDIDDAKHNEYHSLRLTPRLLAKLLTQSYPADPEVRNNDEPLSHNPLNITWDPEFRALNPGIPELTNEAASEMINISSQADLTYALTSYLNADPEARAWLDGKPDPWGMVVNPHYKGIALPVSAWPLLDDFLLPQSYIDSNINACYSNSPSPWLSLVANPTALLSNIAQDMQFALSNVEIVCPNGDRSDPSTLKMKTQGRQAPGSRFLIGLTSLGEVSRYGLTAATLQTTADVPDRSATFSDDHGRTFAEPDEAGLRAAAALFRPDVKTGVWDFDYGALHSSPAAATAYPGTMFVYADVPTTGLPVADTRKLANLLLFAAGPGQQAGLRNGQLPPGYLPIDEQNGLGKLAAYTTRAADAVRAQQGYVPAVDGSGSPPSGGASSSGPAAGGQSSAAPTRQAVSGVPSGPALSGGGGVLPRSTAGPTTARIVAGGPTTAVPAPVAAAQESAGRTPGDTSALGGVVLPALFLLMFLGALLAPAFRYPNLLRRPGLLLGSLVARSGRSDVGGRR